MAVKGASDVAKKYKSITGKIAGKMSEQTINHVLSIGAAQAKIYTPVDTSALINSQRIIVNKTGSGFKGRVLYGQEYAIYLEHNKKWTPRKKKSAKPQFLKLGFEDPKPASRIKKAIINGYKIDKAK